MHAVLVEAVAKHVVHGCMRAIDRDLTEVRPAQPAELGVEVGEQPRLQQRVIGDVDAGHEDEGGLAAEAGTPLGDLLLQGLEAGDHAPLIAAVKEALWLPGQPHVFIHGEAQAVMHNLRTYVRKERGVDAKWASISGYWRRGRTEETFRQWKAELAKAEAGSGD